MKSTSASATPRFFMTPRLAATRTAWLCLLLLALFGIDPAFAGKKWKARFAPKKGQEYRLLMRTDVAVSAKLPLIGGPEGKLALQVETTRRIQERKRRGPTQLSLTIDRIAFDLDLAGQATSYDSGGPPPEGEHADVIRHYAGLLLGRTLTVDVSATGEVIDVQGMDDLFDRLEQLAENDSSLAPLLNSLTRDLGTAALKALLQQATPVFPGGKITVGEAWSREGELPNPLFESMETVSGYTFLEKGRHGGKKAARTEVAQSLTPRGQGPLVAELGRLAGLKGEVRVKDATSTGTTVVWSERKTGLTRSLTTEQRIDATLSIPIKILGFTRRSDVPLKVQQTVSLELLE